VTFLFTDIEGSTKLWEQHPQTMHAALTRHDALLHQAIDAHSGIVVKTAGDGLHAVFARPINALEATIAAQRALQDESWSTASTLRVRMALHTGVAEVRDGDYYGAALNRVAGLLAAGYGGQILLTRATTELVRDELPPTLALRDLGEQRLRDLFRPEHIFQLVAPDLPADFPLLKTLERSKTNLPAQPTPLIGREQEVAAAAAMLRRPGTRLLTLSGAGGIGKTRLALQVAAELLDDFADGVYFVALASISDPAFVPTAIAQALDIREAGSPALAELLAGYLRDKQLLLLLDNFEHLPKASVVVAELLEVAPRLKVLITSRMRLHLYGEHEYVVPSLTLPDPRHVPSLERLTHYEAVRLFIERAQAAKADFVVTNENAPAVAEICMRLDGLPLAIELAAARVKLLSPAMLLVRLTNRLALLTGGARNLPARQQTLRRTIDWSHDLLDRHEQVLFARLGVFVGGCTVEAASAVCNAAGDLPLDIFDGLASLADKSLLRQGARNDDELRFVMLETIREYAREQLVARGEDAVLQQHHAAYYLALAEAAVPELQGAQQATWLARLDAEHDNLRAALAWLLEQQAVERSLRLAGALVPFWHIRGHLSEGRRWLEAALALAGSGAGTRMAKAAPQPGTGHRAALARVLHGAGLLAHMQGDYLAARALYEESLALRRELGDRYGIASALNNLGIVAHYQGDYATARALHEESLALVREVGDTSGIAASLSNLGNIAFEQGDYVTARALREEGLTLMREVGDTSGIAADLGSLAEITLEQGDYVTARALYEESLTLLRGLGNTWGIAASLEGFAAVSSVQGHAEQALRLAAAAAALRQAISAPLSPAEQAQLERWLVLARQALSETTRTAAWEAGRAMTLEQAIASALEPAPQPPGPTPAKASYPAGLTAREVEVLCLVAQGLTDPQVAEQLVLSPRTINAHLASIYGKLGVNSRTAATRFAIDHNLV
jgi:predicted ATPase/class 3 adenylate cyclase/DNA-binding NarL/FixJ family response regulator